MELFTAVILAGGQSRRMGQDKAWLDAGGRPLLVHVAERLQNLAAEVIVVRAAPTTPLPALPARVIEDRYPGMGPLAGLHAGLSASATSWIFAVACDMPLLHQALIRYLALLRPGHDAVIPYPTGQPEPLHAFYHRRCLAVIEQALASGQRSVWKLYTRLQVRSVSPLELTVFDPDLRSFVNVNTPTEWERVRRLIS
ncbi:MAG: molybdenum cofactor guanylyltransferase [Anaerolineae bacterium]|nr:molybdenum cofactor guanylyltransferase [Anaerolineae bacterium]MDW8099126.1 molybdenum cofactor guanylyltransferase [Anaerolineae bacterium]